MKQVTLISLYQQKCDELENLINTCLKIISNSKLGKIFKPYNMGQIHGTIVGLEKLSGYNDHLFNANTWKASGNKKLMEFDEFLNIITSRLPIKIRFGGFEEDYREFMSFENTPYMRSFQVQWISSKYTLIGWPHKKLNFTETRLLRDFRLELETKCNIKHKYENDNDLFMVLGEMKELQFLKESEITDYKNEAILLEHSVREYLQNNPIDIEINTDNIFLTQYEDESLSAASTYVYCIKDIKADKSFITKLYN